MKGNKTISIINWTAAFLVAMLALFAFVLSYSSLQHMAESNGVGQQLSYVWPLLLDFAMIVFSLAILRANLRQESSWYAWTLTIAFAGLAVVGNVLDVSTLGLSTEVVKMGVKALAPVALVLSFELLMSMLRAEVKRNATLTTIADLTQELDTLAESVKVKTAKVAELESELSELAQAKQVLNTPNLTSSLDTANEKRSVERQARLDKLSSILTSEPDTSVKKLAETLGVSRTTIYTDMRTLAEDGILSSNGRG